MGDKEGTPEVGTQATEAKAGAPEAQAAGDSQLTAAQLKTWEEKLTKQQTDLRSQQIQRQRQSERDTLLTGTNEKVDAMASTLNLLVKKLGAEDPELAQAANQLQSEITTKQSNRLSQQMYTGLLGALEETVKDDDGNLILNLDEAPELKEVRRLWDEAIAAKTGIDFVALQQVINQARKIVLAKMKAMNKADVAQAEQKGRKAALEQTGALDMTSGSQALPGGESENLSPRDRIAVGLKKGKSRIFG